METLRSMDALSFTMAFNRFEDIRGECLYLKCDAASNFTGVRNTEEKQLSGQMIGQVDCDGDKNG